MIKERFVKDVVLEKWGAGIAGFLGKAIIAGITIWGANYYYHNIYIFNQNKAIAFKTASKDFALLRTNVNKLSALVRMREHGQLNNMSEKAFKTEVKETVGNITGYEVKISNYASIAYDFGAKVSQKQHNFIYWTNWVATEILKKKFSPPDKITDTFYYSMIYSMQVQLYTSERSRRFERLAKMSDAELAEYFRKMGIKYPLAAVKKSHHKLTYEEIISLQQLANNFK